MLVVSKQFFAKNLVLDTVLSLPLYCAISLDNEQKVTLFHSLFSTNAEDLEFRSHL